MNILHIDLSEGHEDLSIRPNRYGGCQIVPSWYRELRQRDGIFISAADARSFENLREDEYGHTVKMSLEQSKAIRAGESLSKLFVEECFDLVFHNHPDVWVNTHLPTAVWVPGQHQTIHPKNKHLLLHSRRWQKPIISEASVIYDVVIGKPVPVFQEYRKEDFIFQCTNHANCFQSIQLAEICKKNKIRLYLGGPISEGYPLLEHVDHIYVHYLGVMSYNDKIEFTKYARAHTLLHNFPINWTLSGMESLAYGTPLITTPMGFWPEFITPQIGRLVQTEGDIIRAFHELKSVNQKDCWDVANKYNAHVMVDSFEKAFLDILLHERENENI